MTITSLAALSLDTERLRIRALRHADLKQIYKIHSDPVVNKYLPYNTWDEFTQAQVWYESVEQRREEQEAEQFVIEHTIESQNDSTPIIGTCIAFNHKPEQARLEFGYVLARPAWGKGFMFEAMQTFIPALQQTLSLDVLCASVETDNMRSLKLLNKFDFSNVGSKIEEDGIELQLLEKVFK